MKEKKRRKVNYRKARIEEPESLFAVITNTHTLQQLLENALSNLAQRHLNSDYERSDGYTDSLSLVNGKLTNIKGYDFPSSVLVSSRSNDRVAAKKATAIGAHITPALAKDPNDDDVLDPVHSAIYFAISGNDIAYISDARNADTRLKTYFEYLIQHKTKTIDSMLLINLDAWFSASVRKQIENKGIKREALQHICSLLPDEELKTMTIHLHKGPTLKGGELIFGGEIIIETNEGVTSQYSAQRALSEWLKEQKSTVHDVI